MRALLPLSVALPSFLAYGVGTATAQASSELRWGPPDARAVDVGTPVRVGLAAQPTRAPYPRRVEWRRGTIHDIGPDTLFLVTAAGTEVVAIPRLQITDIEESLGVSRAVSAREVGLGLAFFTTLLVVLAQEEAREKGEELPFRSTAAAYSIAAGGGFALGFVIGAIRPYERWRLAWLAR